MSSAIGQTYLWYISNFKIPLAWLSHLSNFWDMGLIFSLNGRLKPHLSKYYRFMGVSMFLCGLKMLLIIKKWWKIILFEGQIWEIDATVTPYKHPLKWKPLSYVWNKWVFFTTTGHFLEEKTQNSKMFTRNSRMAYLASAHSASLYSTIVHSSWIGTGRYNGIFQKYMTLWKKN